MSARPLVLFAALALSTFTSVAFADEPPPIRPMASARLAPANVSATLRTGDCATPSDTLYMPANTAPSSLDLVICMDLSSSMDGELAKVKTNTQNIIDQLRTLIPDTDFGVISHIDYPTSFSGCGFNHGTTPSHFAYHLDRSLTNDDASVRSIVAGLQTIGGGDFFENYSRPLSETYADPNLGWRPGARRIVLQWGDDAPHDCAWDAILLAQPTHSSGPDPGRDGVVGTSDDLRILDVLDGMRANNITLISLHSGGYMNLWQAYAARTGGDAFRINSDGSVPSGTDIASFIANLVRGQAAHLDSLSLRACDPAYASWLSSVEPAAYSNVTLDQDRAFPFSPSICVPPGTAPGTYAFDVCAIGDGAEYAHQHVEIVVAAPLAVSCPEVTHGRVGAAFSSRLLATGGTLPYSFFADSLPPGLGIDPQSGEISGVPTTPGVFAFVARVGDAAEGVDTTACSIEIAPGSLTLSCPADRGRVAEEYRSAIVASGGAPPYHYAVDTLPSGLDFVASTGQIVGFPQESGIVNFTARAIDALNDSVSISCSITILPQALSLACPQTTVGRVGVFFEAQLVARDGVPPYQYALETGRPLGLELDPNTGRISGIPVVPGIVGFRARVVDFAADTAYTDCSITIEPGVLAVGCPDSTTGTVGAFYRDALSVTGGVPPYSFAASDSVPPGLSLDADTGVLSGTPERVGTFTYHVAVRDSGGNSLGSVECALTIFPRQTPPLTLVCPDVGTAQVGVFYASSLRAGGGTPPHTFSLAGGTLPPGLDLDASSGGISGTPTVRGAFTYVARVTDASRDSAFRQCTITVSGGVPPPLRFQCPSDSGVVGIEYRSAIVVFGGAPPYSFQLAGGGLPPGLGLDTQTGEVRGIPQVAGFSSFVLLVTDAIGDSAVGQCAIAIAGGGPPPFTFDCPRGDAAVGLVYDSRIVASGGTPPYHFSILGQLPDGLVLDFETGRIVGTPTIPGTYAFGVRVADAAGDTATDRCRITVVGGPSCTQVGVAQSELWPPNHKLAAVRFTGLRPGEHVRVTGVTQDEPIGSGGGNDCADAVLQNDVLSLRAERSAKGNGRVYTISYTLSGAFGDSLPAPCGGTVKVCVPHDQGHDNSCIADGTSYDSFGPCSAPAVAEPPASLEVAVSIVSSVGGKTFEYSLPKESDVELALYDIAGRRIDTLERAHRTVGSHSATWNPRGVPRGMYFYRLRVGDRVLTGTVALVK